MTTIPTSCGPGMNSSKWNRPLIAVWIYVLVFVALMQHSDAELNKNYHMQTLCKTHFLQLVYRKIDGAILWSQNERNLDCVITFQTHSILQRFMLRFDMLQLDCNDHLYIYDGAHAVGLPKTDLSCRNTRQSVGALITQTNFVTLKYVTDGWGTDSNGFKLIITAVKNSKHTCKEFRCTSNELCIHPDLVCDNVNHCGDGSDELTNTLCRSQDNGTLLGLELTWFVLVAVSSLLIISACIVGTAICFCRRSPSHCENNLVQFNRTAIDSNGMTKYVQSTSAATVAARKSPNSMHSMHHINNTMKTLPLSGNLYRPAELSRYFRKIRNTLLMATVRPIWCLSIIII